MEVLVKRRFTLRRVWEGVCNGGVNKPSQRVVPRRRLVASMVSVDSPRASPDSRVAAQGADREDVMRVLVTGAAGQLGTVVCQRLLDRPEVEEVVGTDLRPLQISDDRLRFEALDVRDGDRLEELLTDCDALVHLAFVVTAKMPREVYDAINIGGSRTVFETAARMGIEKVVYCSSMAAYGLVPGHPVPLVEDSPRVLQEDFPYAAAKYQVEAFLDTFEKEHPTMRIARLRAPVLVGARFGNPLGDLFARSLDRGWLVSPSTSPVTMVWDEDVADAVVLALEQGAHGAFNVCAEEAAPPKEIARAAGLRWIRPPRWLLTVAGWLSPVLAKLGIGAEVDPAWRKQGRAVVVGSSAKARRELGWKPVCPTVAEVLRHYREVTTVATAA